MIIMICVFGFMFQFFGRRHFIRCFFVFIFCCLFPLLMVHTHKQSFYIYNMFNVGFSVVSMKMRWLAAGNGTLLKRWMRYKIVKVQPKYYKVQQWKRIHYAYTLTRYTYSIEINIGDGNSYWIILLVCKVYALTNTFDVF